MRIPKLWISSSYAALIVVLLAMVASAPAQTCTLSTTNPSVTICTPTNNSTVSSPVHVNAGTTDSNTVTLMQIYIDGVKAYEVKSNSLDTTVPMTNGTHRLTVQAKDSVAQTFKSTIDVTASTSGGGGGLSSIQHIIFLVQENRSADDYFGFLGAYRQARGLSANWNGIPLSASLPGKQGDHVSPFHYQTQCTENLSPGWNESHYDVDGGKMDRFLLTTGSVPSTIDPDGTRAIGYYNSSDLPYYYDLAYQFGTSDTWFSPVLAPTIPNRMYLFAATSFGHIRPDSPPSGGWPVTTIFDLLRTHGISWRYYYQDNSTFLAQFAGWPQDKGNVYSISHWYTDVQNPSTLPSVIFIERASSTGLDEHPLNKVQNGSANTRKILEALFTSPSWPSSAFILTFDEGGGLYDHVPPISRPAPDSIPPMLKSGDQQGSFNQSGFRVPLIVISPWSKPHFISHVNRDYTSILKLIETRFGLPSLTNRDAQADDMEEFFDFSSPFWLTPPARKSQPTSETCSFNLEKAPGH